MRKEIQSQSYFTELSVHCLPNKSQSAFAITYDGKYAVSISHGRTLKLWDLEKGRNVSNFTGDSSFRTCKISPDGKSIIAGDNLGNVHFLLLAKGKIKQR